MDVWAAIVGPEPFPVAVEVTELKLEEEMAPVEEGWQPEEYGPPPVDECIAPQGRIAWASVIPEINLSLTDLMLEVLGPRPDAKPKTVLDHLALRLNGLGVLTVHKVASRMQQLRLRGVITRGE